MNRISLRCCCLCWLLAILLAGLAFTPTNAWQRARLTAQLELLNAKVKTRQGKPEASGVVIWLEAPGVSARPNPPRQKLNQRGKRFLPHVMVVEKGSEVDFPNSDPYFHNVFSLFNGKRFDLGLYASGESRPVLFNRVGVSYIFCNIHPLMSAVVVVVDSPYFALSDPNGKLTINDVPEGRYQLKVWHERATPQELASLTRTVQVSSSGTFDLGVVRINEAGYIPLAHPNKHGQPYDNERNKPAYKK
jgi:plastocyanin